MLLRTIRRRAQRRQAATRRSRLGRGLAGLALGATLPLCAASAAHASTPSYITTAFSPTGGGWQVSATGQVGAFGGETTYGSLAGVALAKPVTGIASTPDGKGYWIVASDGGIFAFGDARFYGSTGNLRLAQPVVGMAATPDGGGYWMVASDGGIFAFGDARFYGSTGNLRLAQPVVGMAPAPGGQGYWLVAADGGVFSFGNAPFHGSTGNLRLARPVVGMAATPDGGGYWMVASDGGIFSFGDAPFYGSLGGQALSAPVIGMAPFPSGGYALISSDASYRTFGPTQGTSASATTPSNATSSAPTTTPPASPTTGPAAPGLPVGVNLGGMGNESLVVASPAVQDQTLQALVASGIRSLRLDVDFPGVEPTPGSFSWAQIPFIKEAAKYGVTIDALLDYAPSWALMADGQPAPAAYAQYAAATAAALAPLGVHVFELGNEPNRPNNGVTVNTADYAALLKATYPAIKAVDPSSTVLVGGLADAADTPDDSMMSAATFLTQIYADGAKGSFDGVAIHPASAPVAPMWPAAWNAFYSLPAIHAISVANGDPDVKLWITEYGSPTGGTPEDVSLDDQATFATQAYEQAEQWPWVASFYYFEWQDNPVDGGLWGLTDGAGNPKPALNAIRAMLGEPTSEAPVPTLPIAALGG